DIDRDLRSIAKRQRALDAEEAVLLCAVVRREIWRQLGKGSLLEYLEDVLGYGPKAANERVRVALALDELPMLADALANGEQSYSAIKELTRVATAKTQAEWCDSARGKNVRQIEELVAGRRRGDRPTDPANPDLKPQVVRFEITTATHARLRHVQQVLADEHGGHLDDDALITALCDSILDGHATADDGGRARHQILTTVCTCCEQAWQHGGGRDFAVSATDLAIAECDAQRVGSDREPGTAAQDVAPKVRRFVTLRDRMRCTVPGCRAARHIDVHHIVPRHLSGGHEPENLTLLCSGHHRALHDGNLTITGRAPELVVAWPHGVVGVKDVEPAVGEAQPASAEARNEAEPLPHVGPTNAHHSSIRRSNADGAVPRTASHAMARHMEAPMPSSYQWTVNKTEATLALHKLGYSKPEARAFVEQAAEQLARTASLEQLFAKALQIARRGMAGVAVFRPHVGR
ncbi:MAG TPA: HNH endonuclease, partial [Kofleriaceae bacterium]|nr:HNH endonuclease [Kofleriaceae bacterium]